MHKERNKGKQKKPQREKKEDSGEKVRVAMMFISNVYYSS